VKKTFDPLLVYALLFLVFLYGPVLLMPVFSFNDNIFATFPLTRFTLKHYQALTSQTGMIAALQNSLIVGSFVSVLSTIFGLLAAMAATRYTLPGRGIVLGAIMLPLVVPSIIFGVGLLLISRLEGFDRNLYEASNDLGETDWMTFWRVTLPIAFPGVIASLLMSFTISFDEFVLAFFLSGTDQTLPVYLFSQLRFPQRLPATLALGSAILFASTVILVLSEVLRRRGVSSSGGVSA
jgi:spermidine/putrescine transport system permease protein